MTLLLGFIFLCIPLIEGCTPREEAFVAKEIVKIAKDVEEEIEGK